MKALLSVVLIAFVAQASAQTRVLFCHDCVDCPRVEANTPRTDCYGPVSDPTRVTDSVTVGLTPPTPAVPTTPAAPNQQPEIQNQEDPAQLVDTYISPFEATPRFQCYSIRARIGDRSIMSRGCALISHTKEATCLQHNQGEEPDFCDLCDEDDCNTVAGVGKMFASMTIIFATLFISLRLY